VVRTFLSAEPSLNQNPPMLKVTGGHCYSFPNAVFNLNHFPIVIDKEIKIPKYLILYFKIIN